MSWRGSPLKLGAELWPLTGFGGGISGEGARDGGGVRLGLRGGDGAGDGSGDGGGAGDPGGVGDRDDETDDGLDKGDSGVLAVTEASSATTERMSSSGSSASSSASSSSFFSSSAGPGTTSAGSTYESDDEAGDAGTKGSWCSSSGGCTGSGAKGSTDAGTGDGCRLKATGAGDGVGGADAERARTVVRGGGDALGVVERLSVRPRRAPDWMKAPGMRFEALSRNGFSAVSSTGTDWLRCVSPVRAGRRRIGSVGSLVRFG